MLGIVLAAVVVHLLRLPLHATIEPFGDRALMSVSSDGVVTARATVSGYRSVSFTWRDPNRPAQAAARGLVRLPSCEDFPKASIGAAVAGKLSDGSLIATMLSPAMVDLDDASGQYAPVVLHVRERCLNLGNGVALATSGTYAAGYFASIGDVPAPSNVISEKERFTAMRWHDRTREPMGSGVALAINSAGDAAGADLPPGKGAAFDVVPHARIWIGAQTFSPANDAATSVAYAIDARDRVAGMLQDAAGRHYAFLWQNGRLQRLDDAVRAPGWRFQSAYAFAPDGSVVGIGTFDGRAEAFSISGL